MQFEKANHKHHDLTPNKVRSFKGFEDLTDQQALVIIETLKQFAQMAYDSFTQKNEEDG